MSEVYDKHEDIVPLLDESVRKKTKVQAVIKIILKRKVLLIF